MNKTIDVERMAKELDISEKDVRKQFGIPEPPPPADLAEQKRFEELRDGLGYDRFGKPRTDIPAFDAILSFITEMNTEGWRLGEDYRASIFADHLKTFINCVPDTEKGRRLKEAAMERWKALSKQLLPLVESSHDGWWLHKHCPGNTEESKAVWRRWQECCLAEIETITSLEQLDDPRKFYIRLPSLGKAKKAYHQKVNSLVSMALIQAQTLEQIDKLGRSWNVRQSNLGDRVLREWERVAKAEVDHATTQDELQKLLKLCPKNAPSYQLAMKKLASFYEK